MLGKNEITFLVIVIFPENRFPGIPSYGHFATTMSSVNEDLNTMVDLSVCLMYSIVLINVYYSSNYVTI